MSYRIRKYVILICICISTICLAEQVYTVSPSKITVETPVIITFLLNTSIKTIDSVIFNVSDGILISEYKIIPQKEGIFFTVKLIPKKAGKHFLHSVILKSGNTNYTFDIGAAFIVEGVITIAATWNGPEEAYQYEPFMIVLSIPMHVTETLYRHFANEINKYCEAVYISPNKYLVISGSQFKLPGIQIDIADETIDRAVQFLIKTEPFTVKILDIPAGTEWVTNDSTMLYTVQTKKLLYSSNEPIVFDVHIQATGVPVSLLTRSVRIVGTNGYEDTLEIPLKKHYAIMNSGILSRLEGSGTIILSTSGSYKIVIDPIAVFNVITGKQQLLYGKEIEISIDKATKETTYLQNLLTKEQQLMCAIVNSDTSKYIEELNRLKKETYVWWSSAYASRIAFALIAEDSAYASYQIAQAQKNGIPLLLQVKYPVLYQSLLFAMPAPFYFFVLLCMCGFILLVVIKLQKHTYKRLTFLSIMLIGFMFIVIVLMGIAIYERIPQYGITDATPVYKVPDFAATTTAMCSAGSIVKILSASHAWNYIEFEGKQGWIPTQAILYEVE